jgi:predicted Zn-dependent protease
MQIGGLGAGALLAKYSRDDEREADRLGMEYMVRAGYDPQGMVGLMDVLRGLSSKKPSMVERMFATHPMSSERYKTAVSRLRTSYPDRKSLPVYRQRYLDQTARLRKKTAAIEAMQEGEWALAAEDQDKAVKALSRALTLAPEDYAGLVLMGKCQLARDKPSRAGRYFDKARAVYPQEPQADYFFGVALLYQDKFDQAYAQFQGYEQELPGNPNTIFLQGLALEGAGRRKKSARAYVRFLRTGASGKPASYARGRLKKWGYL